MERPINFFTPDQNGYFSAVTFWFVARILKTSDGERWLEPATTVASGDDDKGIILYTSRLDALVDCNILNREGAAIWQVYSFGDLDVKRIVQDRPVLTFMVTFGYAADERYRLIQTDCVYRHQYFPVTFDLRNRELRVLDFEKGLFEDINRYWLPHFSSYCKSMLTQNELPADELQQYAEAAIACAEVTCIPVRPAHEVKMIMTYSPTHNDWLVAISEPRPLVKH
ncbi:MAG TPA: hypothetical protein VGI71_18120 [Scandinavium sp.]|jgi:hypothetical protein